MKDFKNVLNEMIVNSNNISDLDTKMDALVDKVKPLTSEYLKARIQAKKRGETMPEDKKVTFLNNSIKETDTLLTTCKIKQQILYNNAGLALLEKSKPIVTEVFNKYKGKPLGEKTREKIAREIGEKIGGRCYISITSFHDDINITCDNISIEISVSGPNRRLTDDNNKVIPVNSDDLFVYDLKKSFIDDIEAYITEFYQIREKVAAAAVAYEDLVKQYNEHCYGTMRTIEYPALSHRIF